MKATEILMAEHRAIERVVEALETAANKLSSGVTVPADFFIQASEFIKGFADGCHHRKEERVLFEALVKNGMSRELGPVAVMMAEHEEGRQFARGMRSAAERMKAGDQTAVSEVIENALSYVGLLRQHIQKEEAILFPMADLVIPNDQHSAVSEEFDRIEHEETGEGMHEKYLGLAAELENTAKT